MRNLFAPKKILFFVIGLLVVSGLIYVSYRSFSKQAWLHYKNSRYNFSIEFPPAWHLGAQEMNNAGREMISADKTIVCYAYGFENALDQTLDEFVDWVTSEDAVLSKSNTKLSDTFAIETVALNPESIVRRSVYTFLDDNTGRGFYCIYKNKIDMNAHSKDYERMKESFTQKSI